VSEERLWALLDLCADYYWQEDPAYICTHLRHSPSSVAGSSLLGHLPGQTLWDGGFLVTGSGQSWRAHLAIREARRDFRELICQVAASSDEDRALSEHQRQGSRGRPGSVPGLSLLRA